MVVGVAWKARREGWRVRFRLRRVFGLSLAVWEDKRTCWDLNREGVYVLGLVEIE